MPPVVPPDGRVPRTLVENRWSGPKRIVAATVVNKNNLNVVAHILDRARQRVIKSLNTFGLVKDRQNVGNGFHNYAEPSITSIKYRP